jgi:hypothetical protein
MMTLSKVMLRKANEFYLFVLRLFIATKWIEIIADALVRVL